MLASTVFRRNTQPSPHPQSLRSVQMIYRQQLILGYAASPGDGVQRVSPSHSIGDVARTVGDWLAKGDLQALSGVKPGRAEMIDSPDRTRGCVKAPGDMGQRIPTFHRVRLIGPRRFSSTGQRYLAGKEDD